MRIHSDLADTGSLVGYEKTSVKKVQKTLDISG
jgi:hypothetical protein